MAKKRTTTKATADSSLNQAGTGMDWAEADLTFLKQHLPPAPELPLTLLPPIIETLVRGFSDTQHLNPAYVGPTVLAALSGSIGNRWRIAVAPGKGEPLALFVGMVGRPGSGRSSVIEIASQALQEAETAIIANKANAARAPATSDTVAKHQSRQTSNAVRRILENGGFPADIDEHEAASGPPLVLSDGTGAGFIDELQHDPRGRTLASAEFRGVLKGLMAGQGERGRTILLQAFDGPRYTVKLKSGFIVVPALLLTVLAAIHPQSIADIAGHGLCARFLWSYPDPSRMYKLPKEAGPSDVLAKISADLVASGGSGSSGEYYDTIKLSDEARDVLDRAYLTFTAGIEDMNDRLHDVYSRGAQQAQRLSGIFALAETVGKGQQPIAVSGEDAERAVGLMSEFFLPMAERALGASTGNNERDPATQLARHLRWLGKATINSREDILRGRGSPLRDAGLIQDALRELQLRGLLRPAERIGLGRPAQNWHVHPGLLNKP